MATEIDTSFSDNDDESLSKYHANNSSDDDDDDKIQPRVRFIKKSKFKYQVQLLDEVNVNHANEIYDLELKIETIKPIKKKCSCSITSLLLLIIWLLSAFVIAAVGICLYFLNI